MPLGIFEHPQTLQRASDLEDVKAVVAHAELRCRRIQSGRRYRVLPGTAKVPPLASDEARDGTILRHGTTEIRLPLVSE